MPYVRNQMTSSFLKLKLYIKHKSVNTQIKSARRMSGAFKGVTVEETETESPWLCRPSPLTDDQAYQLFLEADLCVW